MQGSNDEPRESFGGEKGRALVRSRSVHRSLRSRTVIHASGPTTIRYREVRQENDSIRLRAPAASPPDTTDRSGRRDGLTDIVIHSSDEPERCGPIARPAHELRLVGVLADVAGRGRIRRLSSMYRRRGRSSRRRGTLRDGRVDVDGDTHLVVRRCGVEVDIRRETLLLADVVFDGDEYRTTSCHQPPRRALRTSRRESSHADPSRCRRGDRSRRRGGPRRGRSRPSRAGRIRLRQPL